MSDQGKRIWKQGTETSFENGMIFSRSLSWKINLSTRSAVKMYQSYGGNYVLFLMSCGCVYKYHLHSMSGKGKRIWKQGIETSFENGMIFSRSLSWKINVSTRSAVNMYQSY